MSASGHQLASKAIRTDSSVRQALPTVPHVMVPLPAVVMPHGNAVLWRCSWVPATPQQVHKARTWHDPC